MSIFKLRKKNRYIKPTDQDPIEQHEQNAVNAIISKLETNPESFSAKWFSGTTLDNSVKFGEILILIHNGQISSPVEFKMSAHQKNRVKELIAPIVKRDSDYLINKLLKDI